MKNLKTCEDMRINARIPIQSQIMENAATSVPIYW
jgi:hypothetical protein